jgi:hypothetical protein
MIPIENLVEKKVSDDERLLLSAISDAVYGLVSDMIPGEYVNVSESELGRLKRMNLEFGESEDSAFGFYSSEEGRLRVFRRY